MWIVAPKLALAMTIVLGTTVEVSLQACSITWRRTPALLQALPYGPACSTELMGASLELMMSDAFRQRTRLPGAR